MTERTCIICDTPLTDRQKLACSTPCRMKHYWTTPAGQAAKARAAANQKARNATPCIDCGEPTTKERCNPCARGRHSDTRGSCTECGRLRVLTDRRCVACIRASRNVRRSRAERIIAVAAHGSTGKRWSAGRCNYCGAQFTALGIARFCSRRCMQRNARAVARARRHDVWIRDVRRYAVFENHGWVCHICHEPIDPTLPLNDPMVATLDHVIPLVGRGPHVESNLRPAHMMCNSLKSMDEHGQPCTVS